MKSKHIEFAKNSIVGGVEVYESAFATIRYCNITLFVDRTLASVYITKSRNISVSGVSVHSESHGISVQHSKHTRIVNVTLFTQYTGLDLLYSIDTQVLNACNCTIFLHRNIHTVL